MHLCCITLVLSSTRRSLPTYTSLPACVTSRISTLNKLCESKLGPNEEPCSPGSNGRFIIIIIIFLFKSCPDSLPDYAWLIFLPLVNNLCWESRTCLCDSGFLFYFNFFKKKSHPLFLFNTSEKASCQRVVWSQGSVRYNGCVWCNREQVLHQKMPKVWDIYI